MSSVFATQPRNAVSPRSVIVGEVVPSTRNPFRHVIVRESLALFTQLCVCSVLPLYPNAAHGSLTAQPANATLPRNVIVGSLVPDTANPGMHSMVRWSGGTLTHDLVCAVLPLYPNVSQLPALACEAANRIAIVTNFMRRLCRGRKHDRDRGANTDGAIDLESATGDPDQPLALRDPQPGPLGTRREERRADALERLRRHSDTGIADLQLEHAVVRRRLDRHPPVRNPACRDR